MRPGPQSSMKNLQSRTGIHEPIISYCLIPGFYLPHDRLERLGVDMPPFGVMSLDVPPRELHITT